MPLGPLPCLPTSLPRGQPTNQTGACGKVSIVTARLCVGKKSESNTVRRAHSLCGFATRLLKTTLGTGLGLAKKMNHFLTNYHPRCKWRRRAPHCSPNRTQQPSDELAVSNPSCIDDWSVFFPSSSLRRERTKFHLEHESAASSHRWSGDCTAPSMTNRFRVGKHEFSRSPFPFSIMPQNSGWQFNRL